MQENNDESLSKEYLEARKPALGVKIDINSNMIDPDKAQKVREELEKYNKRGRAIPGNLMSPSEDETQQ